MKDIVEFFGEKNVIFKKLDSIDIKQLNSRKKLKIYSGVDTRSNYVAIFKVLQKSRFVVKNAKDIEILYKKLISICGHNYKKRFMLLYSPICSKAKKYLQELGWRVYAVV